MQDNQKERLRAIALKRPPSARQAKMLSSYCREFMWWWDTPSPVKRYFREVDARMIGGHMFTRMWIIRAGSREVVMTLLMDGKQIAWRDAVSILYEQSLSEISEGERNA